MPHNELKYLLSEEGIDYYLFRPTFGKWYYIGLMNYKKPTLSHWIRMMIEYCEGGYDVYYMKIENRYVGYIVVARGGRRLKCSSKQDIVLGPIWVDSECRNQGIAKRAVHTILESIGISYENAYEYIKKDNLPSQKVALSNGYINIGEARERGFFRRIYMTNNGNLYIFQYKKAI